MQPSNNIYIGADPLLGSNANYSIDNQMQELERFKALLSQKEQTLMQLKTQMVQNSEQKAVSSTPVWDDIDKEIQSMSDAEYDLVSNNQEFIDSSNAIAAIVQSAYMEMMRPIVEKSSKGKDALDNHLTLVKRLKKAASSEANKQIADFKEYTEKYSDMTYADYLKMKNGTLKSNQP